MMRRDAARPRDHLFKARDHLEVAAELVREIHSDVTVDELYSLAGTSSDMVMKLDGLIGLVYRVVGDLPNTQILRDDAGQDPHSRLEEGRRQLSAMQAHLQEAHRAAEAYHVAIGHVAVDVDLDSELGGDHDW